MELVVFRQSSKVREDGTVVYHGEDTLPYVGPDFFLVADGLGGGAGIRHTSINPKMFDRDTIAETLLEGVYNDADDDFTSELVSDYIRKAFFEIYHLKDCYLKNIHNIKKSGYFGSRFTAAILIRELTRNPEYVKTLFNSINSEDKDIICSKFGEYIAKLIHSNLQKFALNANIKNESKIRNLSLLGTTLCATLFQDKGDYVETLYLTAGDSRPYIWQPDKGLMQILPDEEGTDGGMTNYINGNPEFKFKVRCNYYRFEKPCILFNTTDGCFDSGRFLSQLSFEKLILETICNSVSMEDVSAKLKEFFEEAGRHDDSSTMALKCFGFADYDELKKYASERLAVIQKEYIDEMPDLLEKLYVSDDESDNDTEKKIEEVKALYDAIGNIRDYCRDQAISDPVYISKIGELNSRITTLENERTFIIGEIRNLVMSNFLKFTSSLGFKVKTKLLAFVNESTVRKTELNYDETVASYLSEITYAEDELVKAVDDVMAMLTIIKEGGVPDNWDSFDGIDKGNLDKAKTAISQTITYITRCCNRSNTTVDRLFSIRSNYASQNRKLAEFNPETFEHLVVTVLSGKTNISSVGLSQSDEKKLVGLLEEYSNKNTEIERLSDEEAPKLLEMATRGYWDENYFEIIDTCTNGNPFPISDDILADAKKTISEIKSKKESKISLVDKQKELFEKYDRVYLSLMGEKKAS